MMIMTEIARDKIAELLSPMPQGGVRVEAILGGCAGIRYVLGFAAAPAPGDIVVRDGGAALFVDAASAPSLTGTVVDFVADVGGGGFTFDNPNAVGRCSCSDPDAPCARAAS
ncbi:iron-sulfur cluster assembly accessory protein [Oleispirillum naphthae]|uniref:HesB/IscA family protein n=1 Tax=Oleispirillum naphthae TaxID=2838853 RepID=UPI0030822602